MKKCPNIEQYFGHFIFRSEKDNKFWKWNLVEIVWKFVGGNCVEIYGTSTKFCSH